MPIILSIRNSIARDSDEREFVDTLRGLAAHARGRVAAYQLDAVEDARPDAGTAAFLLKRASVELRASDPRALVAQMTVGIADLAYQTVLYRNDVAPYVDFICVTPAVTTTPAGASLLTLIQQSDPTAGTIVTGVALDSRADAGVRHWLPVIFDAVGAGSRAATVVAGPDTLAAVVNAAAQMRDVVGGDVVALDDASVSLVITTADGQPTTVPHRLLYNLTTLSTYLAFWDLPASARLQISQIDANGRQPTLRDPIERRATALPFTWDPSSKALKFAIAGADRAEFVDLNYGAATSYVSRAEVGAEARLSVAEIIAKEQLARAVQDTRFKTWIADARMEMHFRPVSTDAFQVVTENRFYADRSTVEWEELSFAVNGGKWGPDRPAFPLLQAEKVLSLPLELRFTSDYTYRLDGMDTLDGRRCYVVAFDPLVASSVLYRGRVWIDAETFQRLKVNTIQSKGKAPFVSSEETQVFGRVADVDGTLILLPVEVTTEQIFLIAGQTLVVEKAVRYSNFQIDTVDFDARRRAAHASDHVMFRDTDQGLRYLARQGADRIVSDRITTTAKALAMGTTIDPSYSYPLPIFGINYLNFNFGSPNSQLALLFAGVLALGNIQMPHLGTSPFDASIDFFGIAVPSNDIVVDASGERKGERVLNIPGNVGVNAGWQFTPFQKVKASYQLRYDFYFHDTVTDPGYVLPKNTLTNGIGAGYEYKRLGYALGVGGSVYRRASTAPWGEPAALNAPEPSYQRYSATASKDFFLTTFQTVHVGGGWYGGAHLDRFSMYQFGLFDEVRMHGVPSAGIRFPELALVRGSYSFNVFDQYRLDLFLDQAIGRDPDDRSTWRPITGTGVAVNFRTPWNTMFKVDVGKSFLPAAFAKTGSWVIQFLLLKPL